MRGCRIRVYAVALAVALGLCPGKTSTAWAQPKKGGAQAAKKGPAAPTDPSLAEFEKHFEAGKAAAKANRWDAARQEFLLAFDLKPDHAQTVALLAQAEMATGRHREAAEHLDIFLEYAVGILAEDRKTAEDLLIEAQSKLAIVTVVVDKPGAKISVDGRVLGKSPLPEPVLVDAGHRRFEAEGPDGRARVEVDLEPRTTPTVKMVLKSETRIIKESQTWRTGAIFGGMGLSVVGIGVGVGFLVGASSKNTEATELAGKIKFERNGNEILCPPTSTDTQCGNLRDLQSQRNTFGNVALAGFIVGGVATVGTLALWLTAPKGPPKKKDAVLILPSLGGVSVSGTF